MGQMWPRISTRQRSIFLAGRSLCCGFIAQSSCQRDENFLSLTVDIILSELSRSLKEKPVPGSDLVGFTGSSCVPLSLWVLGGSVLSTR